MERLLYSRKDAAEALSINVSSLDVLIKSGRIRVRRHGVRVFVPAAALEDYAKRDQGPIWPAKQNGKTVWSFSQAQERYERASQ